MLKFIKQFLIRILPAFLKKRIQRIRFEARNIAQHKSNLQEGRVARIVCQNSRQINIIRKQLDRSFIGTIQFENFSFYFHPVAIIQTPKTMADYLKEIGPKSRNMIQKAEKRGVTCKQFNWNEHLEEIEEINTSSEFRQGRKMDSKYQDFPSFFHYPSENDHSILHLGAWIENKLVGYVELCNYGNYSIINRILGHKNFLNLGIMNILIRECVQISIASKKIEYLNYLSMLEPETNSLSAFKKRVGFREFSLIEPL